MLLVSFCSPPHNTFSVHQSWILLVIWFWCFAGRRLWWDENERRLAIKMHFWIRKISFSSACRKTRSRSIAWIQFFFFGVFLRHAVPRSPPAFLCIIHSFKRWLFFWTSYITITAIYSTLRSSAPRSLWCGREGGGNETPNSDSCTSNFGKQQDNNLDKLPVYVEDGLSTWWRERKKHNNSTKERSWR